MTLSKAAKKRRATRLYYRRKTAERTGRPLLKGPPLTREEVGAMTVEIVTARNPNHYRDAGRKGGKA